MNRTRAVVVALVLGMSLVGCSSVVSADAPVRSGAPTGSAHSADPVSPAPEVSATSGLAPEASPAPTGAAAVITTAGYGDLRLGRAVPDTTTLVRYVPTYCADNYGDYYSSPDYKGPTGAWIPKHDGSVMYVVNVTSKSTSAIARLTFESPDFVTKSGAHTGMTLAQLESLFPTAKKLEPYDGVTLLVVSDSLGRVVFDIGTSTSGEATAKFIHVIPRDAEPLSVQNTDTAGNCPP